MSHAVIDAELTDEKKQFYISQLSVNMVKRVLGRVNKVERGLFKLFRGSIAARQNQRMEYLRVFSPCLDRQKRWYVFYSKLTNLKPSKFSKRALFENFPEKVRKVPASLLTTEDGQPLSSSAWFTSKYKANSSADQQVYLVTSFGLYVASVNHKNTLEVGKEFDFYRVLLNSFCLDDNRAKTSKMPAKIDLARAGVNSITPSPPLPDFPNFALLQEQIVQKDKLINNSQINLENYREKIQTLQAQLRDKIAKPVSFRTTARSDAGSTLKEISENDDMTAMARKRKMDSKASCVFEELEEVAERHRESLASILAHLACCERKPEARNLLWQIVDLFAEEKGVSKAVKVILSDETFYAFMHSMAVPDWVLLYFKISARLPDGAWQMLLNLTKLGDTKVSSFRLFFLLP